MVLQPEHCNVALAALLYMAEKYRLIVLLADRFDDGAISDSATNTERQARRLSATIAHEGITAQADAECIGVALAAWADNTNRQMQKLYAQGMVQDGALLEHNLRKVYEVIPAVESVALSLSLSAGAPAEAAEA